jgi:hypothetical protein
MARKPPKGKSLAEVNPELAKQWHTSKNGDLTPFDLTVSSNKKVWWKCTKGNDHEWLAPVSRRSNGSECGICTNRITVLSNSLATINPELAKQWHPTKNGNLTPFDVNSVSGKKVWWKCDKADDHEWNTSINNRSRGGSCPMCSGHRVVVSNSLATINPELAKQWHPTKNGNLTPYDLTVSSNKKVWWKCPEGDDHEWQAQVSNRNNSEISCSICTNRVTVFSNCLRTTHPELAKQWHPTKNGDLTPIDISFGSNKKVWWKCDKADDHEWRTSVVKRSNGSNCPACGGQKVVNSNSLAITHPEVAKEWHPTKNGDLTPYDVTANSNKKVWWKCDKADDHEWSSVIASKIRSGCSVCRGRTIVLSNSLAATHPEVAKEWHPTKNGDLTPHDVYSGSTADIWWKCDKGEDHEWEVEVRNRSQGSTCPICSGNRVVVSNSLATINPELAKQWHPTKNGNLTPYDVTARSGKKVWWQCDKEDNHEWYTSIAGMRDCPNCAEYGFNPSKPSFFYIRDIKVSNKRAIKFGITNQMDGGREKKQKRNLNGEMNTILKIETKGIFALEIENKCKMIYGRDGYLSHDEFPDGFTETIKYSEESLNKIKSIVDEVLTEKAEKKK